MTKTYFNLNSSLVGNLCAYLKSESWMFPMHILSTCKLSLWLKNWKSEHNKYPIRVGLCKKCPVSYVYANPVCGKLTSVDDSKFLLLCEKKNKKNRKGQLYKTLKPRIISCIFNGLVIWLEFHRTEHLVHV